MFNKSFTGFFDFLLSKDVIAPDLLKVKVDEFEDVISFKYQIACYVRDTSIYNLIYDKFCEYDRDCIVSVMVATNSTYELYNKSNDIQQDI